MTIKIGLIGEFQSGKSTLINCLLEDRIALTGNGISTTKQVIRYSYSSTPSLFVNQNKTKVQIPISEYSTIISDEKISYLDVGLPIPFLKQTELLDTPGFNANQRDTDVTKIWLDQMDCALIVNTKAQLTTECIDILIEIHKRRIPFIILFNFNDWKMNPDCWIPNSEANMLARKTIGSQVEQRFQPIKINNANILSINTAFFWYSILSNKKQFTLESNNGEKMLMKSVENFTKIVNPELKSNFVSISNIHILKDFLSSNTIAFNNIHVLIQIFNDFGAMRNYISNI